MHRLTRNHRAIDRWNKVQWSTAQERRRLRDPSRDRTPHDSEGTGRTDR